MNLPCSKSLIRANQVTVKVPNSSRVLVDQVSFDIKAGEIVSIIGPNGAGKSTLLKALAGDMDYTGEIKFSDFSTKHKYRARQLGVLPQFSLLSFPYRVHEVVGLGRIPHETGWQRDQQIIKQALSLFDIDYLVDRKYTDLSGGEKQRVQLARVLCQIWSADDAPHKRRALLLDEPATSLDLGHQHQLMKRAREFATQGVAVVMVMHDINLAAQYSDKILAMVCSQSVGFGTAAEVITQDVVSKLFQTEVDILSHPSNGSPIIISR